MHLIEKILYHFRRHPNAIAIAYQHLLIDYATLEKEALACAALLQNKNISNTFIGIRIDDPVKHIYAILGVVISGNYYISITSENDYLLSLDAMHLPYIWLVDDDLEINNGQCFHYHDWVSYKGSFSGIGYTLSNYLCGFFTSGSTAKPKLVLHTHETISSDTNRQVDFGNLSKDDCFDFIFSFSFSASLACIFTAFSCGAKLAIYPIRKMGLSDLPKIWEIHAVTHSSISVSTFRTLCKLDFPFKSLSNLKELCVSGEAHLEKDVYLFLDVFPNTCKLEVAYATTETRTIARQLISLDNFHPKIIGSLGKPVGDKFVSIRDEFGNTLEPMVSGEIFVQSKFIANQYIQDKEASLKAFFKDGDTNVYRTGDFGYLDEVGNLYYQGRVSQEDKINGAKINFFILEKLIESLPEVDRAFACIELVDQQPKLLLAYAASMPLANEYIYQSISSKLPSNYLPVFTSFFEKLPQTHSGKPDKAAVILELKNRYTANQSQANNQWVEKDDISTQLLVNFSKALQAPFASIGVNQHFVLDLGGDSMAAFICIGYIESDFNVRISLQEFMDAACVNELSNLIKKRMTIEQVNFFSLTKISGSPYQKEGILFINIFDDQNFNDLYVSELKDRFQLYELKFNLFYEHLNYQLAIKMLADKINDLPIQYLFGYSFSGFVAYSVSCFAKHIKQVCMLDTIYYFNQDQLASNSFQRFQYILSSSIAQKDLIFPLLYGRNWTKNFLNQKLGLKFIKSTLPSEATLLYYEKIQKVIKEVTPNISPASCLYFYAARNTNVYQNDALLWEQLFVGESHTIYLNAFHGELGSTRNKKEILKYMLRYL